MSTQSSSDAPPPAAHPLAFLQTLADRITLALNVIGTLLIIALMILVNSDVIGRGLLNAPISGVPEMVSMSIVAIVFLQVAQTFRRGRLTRSEALLGWIGRKTVRGRALLEAVFLGGAILIMLQVFSASAPLFVKSWERNTYEGTIGDFTAPIWPVKLVILIGCAALLLQLSLSLVRALYALWRGSPLTGEKGDG